MGKECYDLNLLLRHKHETWLANLNNGMINRIVVSRWGEDARIIFVRTSEYRKEKELGFTNYDTL